jgi:hypothetical protein
MILSKKVVVKNSKFWKSLNYISDLRYIEVDINDLTSGSHAKILARCDYCGKDKEIDYKSYNKNISVSIYGKFSCSPKCGVNKTKENNLVKWGVEFPNQLEQHKEKCRNTIREKYGVEHISQLDSVRKSKSDKMILKSDDVSKRITSYWDKIDNEQIKTINDKRKATNLEKYGVEHVTQVNDFKEKIKKTNLEKWGGFTYQSSALLKKVEETNLERWGIKNPSSSKIIRDKVEKTNLERWGFKTPSQNENVKNKLKNSVSEKWGVDNIMWSDEFRKEFNISNELNYIRYIGDRNYEFSCEKCNNNYIIDYDNYYKRGIRGVERCTVCFPISDSSSIKEKELLNYISSIYGGEIINNYRDKFEIDIYLPELNIGFEFNGLWWHSDLYKSNNYHLDKTTYFKNIGIKIIHIWEDDWDIRKEIIKSQIKNWIGINSNTLFARRCSVREVFDVDLVRKFLNENHIQGFIRSTIKIGLFFGDELMSLMTFDTLEGRKSMELGGFNLSRFCSKRDFNIIGGASRLLTFFIKNYNPNRIISFADMDWSDGYLYYKLGFKLSNTLKPDYKYVKNNIRLNKQKFTKKKLMKEGFSESDTESESTKKMGMFKVYNVGQLKFELVIN